MLWGFCVPGPAPLPTTMVTVPLTGAVQMGIIKVQL